MHDSLEERPGCSGLLARLFGRGHAPTEPAEADQVVTRADYAYLLRDDFLSPAEANLLRVLRDIAGDWALVCPKVRLADLVYTPRQEDRQAALNRVSRKHLDFVLCDAATLRPALAIELDDRSHARDDRRERDAFVDRVLDSVGLPLVRVPAQRSYDTRALAATLAAARASAQVASSREVGATGEAVEVGGVCPRCGGRLERRMARHGQRAGEAFLGCCNYPQCRYTATLPT